MRTLTYFISDLHLGARYIPDPRAHEARVVRWLRRIGPTAKRIYMVGDILDYWYEYREVVPRGFTRFFGAVAELTDAGVEVVWLKGNHDIWTFGYLERELGVKVVDGILLTELDGRRFLIEHGDGVGKRPAMFRMLRRLFRSRVAQWMFSAIHPRWTVAFAHRWSSSSRSSHEQAPPCLYDPEEDPLLAFAREYNATHPRVDYFIFGHRHLLVDIPVDDEGARMVILGDWITRLSYAVWDGNELTLRIENNKS